MRRRIVKKVVFIGLAVPIIVFLCIWIVFAVFASLPVVYLHEPAILRQADLAFRTTDGASYFFADHFLRKYDYTLKNHNRICSFYKDDFKLNSVNAFCNGKYVIILGELPTKERQNNIQIYDYSLSLVDDLFVENYSVCDVLIFGDIFYYLSLNKADGYEDKKLSLWRYDIVSKENILIDSDTKYDSVYNDGDNVLEIGHSWRFVNHYSNGRKKLSYWTDRSNNRSDLHKYCRDVDLHIDNNIICIENKENLFEINVDIAPISFYEKAYKIDNYLVFAVVNKVEQKDCNECRLDCICNYGESYLIKFDLANNKVIDIISYNSGTFLIDYDLDATQYYYDGALFINDTFTKHCETITHGELKKLNGQTVFPIGKEKLTYYLSYCENEFMGI